MDWQQAVYFFLPLSCASLLFLALRKMLRSPRMAHKAPVMQAITCVIQLTPQKKKVGKPVLSSISFHCCPEFFPNIMHSHWLH